MSAQIGSVEVGKLADLVLWSPPFFGVKPDLVLKGGSIAAAPMGDPNASIPTPQPCTTARCSRASAATASRSAVLFVSRAALEADIAHPLGLTRPLVAVANTRGGISKKSMILNEATPKIEVNPQNFEVRADGQLLTCEPAKVLPMAQRYFLF
jgi:urease subunit alpha